MYTQQIPGSSCNEIIRHTQQIPGTSLPWDHQAHTADPRHKFAMGPSGTHSRSQTQVCYEIIRHTQQIPASSLLSDHQAHTADPRVKFGMRLSGTHSRSQGQVWYEIIRHTQQTPGYETSNCLTFKATTATVELIKSAEKKVYVT